MSQNQLDELIPEYGENKSKFDALKKVCDNQNSKIKSLMRYITSYEAGEYVATKTIRVSESFNEDALIEVLHTVPEVAQDLIKTKEYVDMDAFESALYHGRIEDDLLSKINKCRVRKETVALSVKKAKKG